MTGSTSPSDELEPRRNRQHERSQMSTGRLLTAAAELFAEHGYRQTTLADIGKRAGYSHGLVTRRFGSKQGLLIALVDHMVDTWMQRMLRPSVAGQTGIAGIRAFYAAFGRNAAANATTVKALESLMFEGLWGEDELKERLVVVQQHGEEQFRSLIVAGISAGTVRADVDVDAAVLMGTLALRGATYSWLLEDAFDIAATLNSFGDVLDVLLRP